MFKAVPIEEFLHLSDNFPIIDVRSESEFDSGHIPNAVNIPILTNDQRKIVGTLFKQHGRNAAVFKGLELSGPNLGDILKKGIKLTKGDKILVHCWRGGMRSQFYAFLVHFYGLEPILLKGGYKIYRNAVLKSFERKLNIIVLGGYTGSGKTILLQKLKESGEQIIDLEALANHRGSSFGAIGMDAQPSQEQFENNLYNYLETLDPEKEIWIEDEGRTIGDKVIPEGLWLQMKSSPKMFVDRTFQERIDQIMEDYGNAPLEDLKTAMLRIGKRLGPQHVKKAMELLENGQISEAFEIALIYYDKTYTFGLEKNINQAMQKIDGKGMNYISLAQKLILTKNGGK